MALSSAKRLVLASRATLSQHVSEHGLSLPAGPCHQLCPLAAFTQHHHNIALILLMARKGNYARWVKATSRMMGQLKLLKFPIGKSLIQRPLFKGTALQACNTLFKCNTLRCNPQYGRTVAILTCKRKYDLRKVYSSRNISEYHMAAGLFSAVLGKHLMCARAMADWEFWNSVCSVHHPFSP